MKLCISSSTPGPLSVSLIFLLLYFRFPLLQVHALGNETDRLSLLKFKQGITSGISRTWNSSLHFCSWYGVTCSRRHQRVTSLVLQGQNMVGSISPHIANLTFLRVLNLRKNSFHGYIPQELGNLFRLQQLLLNNNSLSGEIPSNLSFCTQLKAVYLSFNRLDGRIPWELGDLENLETLFLGSNTFGGEIPPSLSNLSSLNGFSVLWNELVGEIPVDIGRLKSLTFFGVGANHLSGTIPPSFFNLSSLYFISFASNQLSGSIPETMGETLPNLERVHMGGNEFSGSIPHSFPNASYLQLLDFSFNKLEGQVPNLGNHPELFFLGVSKNNLGSNSSRDLMFLASLKNSTNLEALDLSYNNFGGVLPDLMANLSTNLTRLHLGGNHFTGTIPAAIQNLINLISLGMEANLFTGVIPSYLGQLQKLQSLTLQGNRLSGPIPTSIGNLTRLADLVLAENHLTGKIPSSIGNCTSLSSLTLSGNDLEGQIPPEILVLSSLSINLRLSYNSLSGNLPAQVGKLVNLNNLDVAENRLTGVIPVTIGDCSALVYLQMQGNAFQGGIPSALASLRGLQHLDLSRNNLTGEIPKDLQNLRFLQYLNLSFNDLEGEVPTQGVFANASQLSLVGNDKLCGGILELLLPKCPGKLRKNGKSRGLKIAVITTSICVLVGVLLMLASVIAYRRRKSRRSSSATQLSIDLYAKVSYQELHNTTNGFSSEFLIGSGGFGSVYKGHLKEMEKPIAIKVLKLEQKDAIKSLIAECDVLKNVRHRNLVKLLSFCSSIDNNRNEFKALIFEFMENGSLDEWLHGSKSLTFLQRLNIAIDIAAALHYLHDLYETPIIHCDLKPSNVLIDKDMVAHVSDFGLAKFLSVTNDVSQSQSSTTGIRGTIGYSPPEYAMGNPVSKEGDVYSYGIVLLEMFTGKRPVDLMFKDDLNLHSFVNDALPNRVWQIVDETLVAEEMEEHSEEIRTSNNSGSNPKATLEKCLILVLEVGIACSRDLQKERIKMEDAVNMLDSIRGALVG